MEIIKLNIHSIVDVITNSSTTIYTYQSKNSAIELVNEILKLMNETIEATDVFSFAKFCEDASHYTDKENIEEYIEEEDMKILNLLNIDLKDGYISTGSIDIIQNSILDGIIEKPKWMITIEEEIDYNEYEPSISLYIKPKNEKYTKLGTKLLEFLNSPHHEACHDG